MMENGTHPQPTQTPAHRNEHEHREHHSQPHHDRAAQPAPRLDRQPLIIRTGPVAAPGLDRRGAGA